MRRTSARVIAATSNLSPPRLFAPPPPTQPLWPPPRTGLMLLPFAFLSNHAGEAGGLSLRNLLVMGLWVSSAMWILLAAPLWQLLRLVPEEPDGVRPARVCGMKCGKGSAPGASGGGDGGGGLDLAAARSSLTFCCSNGYIFRFLVANFLYADSMGTVFHLVMVFARTELGFEVHEILAVATLNRFAAARDMRFRICVSGIAHTFPCRLRCGCHAPRSFHTIPDVLVPESAVHPQGKSRDRVTHNRLPSLPNRAGPRGASILPAIASLLLAAVPRHRDGRGAPLPAHLLCHAAPPPRPLHRPPARPVADRRNRRDRAHLAVARSRLGPTPRRPRHRVWVYALFRPPCSDRPVVTALS